MTADTETIESKMERFSDLLQEAKAMNEFTKLTTELSDAITDKVRREEPNYAAVMPRAFGRFIAYMSMVLSIKDIERRKQKIITLTQEQKND